MKKLFFSCLLQLVVLSAYSQSVSLLVRSSSVHEQKIIDSIAIKKQHNSVPAALAEANALIDALQKKGYLESSYIKLNEANDTLFALRFELKSQTKLARIFCGKQSELFSNTAYSIKGDTLIVPYNAIENALESALKKLEKNGEVLAKLQLVSIEKHGHYITADLKYTAEQARKLNALVLRGFTNFPSGHIKSLNKQYQKNTFNASLAKRIKKDFDSYPFCTQIKPPEIQFTKDSTFLYIYVQKRNANSFDGFIGFANNESNKVVLSGYVDLQLLNVLNRGESIEINWKSNGNQQKSFSGQVELPYLFGSPLALKTNLQIFQQDSTFQRTKTEMQLGYWFRFNKRMYIGYQSTESSDIQNVNLPTISDFKNQFTTANYTYTDYSSEEILFPERAKVNVTIGLGNRNTSTQKNRQQFISSFLLKDWKINAKNNILLRNELYYLQSKTYLINELFRFGGINSIVGFNENSLQANFLNATRIEYRKNLSSTLYWTAIIDYGIYQDKTITSQYNSLTGIGSGLKLANKNGMLSILYSVGSTAKQKLDTQNALIQISFKTNF
ncbi:MAG: hypothetical protein FGM16_05840 [Flavobacterium sp.]|nr:hypothetical protein [Flavobacterium sp.]